MRATTQYNGRQAFLDQFTPRPGLIVADAQSCVMGDTPTLAVADAAFGPGTALMLIASHLFALNEHTNATVKMTGQQARECAAAIVGDERYRGLKAAEVVLFFERLKAGHYGHMYNAVDSLHITAALAAYCKEMDKNRRRWDEEEKHNQRVAEEAEHARHVIKGAAFREWKKQWQERHGDNQ